MSYETVLSLESGEFIHDGGGPRSGGNWLCQPKWDPLGQSKPDPHEAVKEASTTSSRSDVLDGLGWTSRIQRPCGLRARCHTYVRATREDNQVRWRSRFRLGGFLRREVLRVGCLDSVPRATSGPIHKDHVMADVVRLRREVQLEAPGLGVEGELHCWEEIGLQRDLRRCNVSVGLRQLIQ